MFSRSTVFSSRTMTFSLLLLWMAVIFSFSMLSGKATVGAPPLLYFVVRKGAHVVEYAVLMFLSFRYFRLCFSQESFRRVIVLAATFSLMYAATDELHQFFVPFRGAKMTAVGIDGLGILLATVLLFFWYKNKNRSQ